MHIITKTERFFIRQYLAHELDLYVNLLSDERLTPYLPKRDEELNKKMFGEILEHDASGAKLGKWGIFGFDGDYIGFIMLKPNVDQPDTAELGYVLHHRYWKQGIATEACRAVINYGFEQKLKVITAIIVPENVASERVLLHIGLLPSHLVTTDGQTLSHFKISR